MTKENLNLMINDIKEKASNNTDNETYVRVEKYGFPHTTDGANECKKILDSLPDFEYAKLEGKGLLYVKVKK